MKIREIILDFTSLLDVIMIILFFFVLYSTIDTDKITNQAKEAEQNYNNLIVKQQEINDEAEKELERIKSADENAVANQKALNAFEKGEYYTISLDVLNNSDDWNLKISFSNKIIGEINSKDTNDLKSSIKEILKTNGVDKNSDDKYLCIFTFNGEQFGTAKAFSTVSYSLEEVQREYPNLYISNLNTK